MKRLGKWLALAGLVAGFAVQAYAISATEIVNKAANLNATLKDYQVTLQIAISSAYIEAPKLLVRLSYKRPDKVRLDPLSGFAVLPEKQVMFGSPLAEMKKHSNFSLEGERKLKGRRCYLLKITPKEQCQAEGRVLEPPLYAWIDAERFTLEQLKSKEEGFSLLVRFTNAKYAGKYWLPQQVDVTIESGREEPMKMKVQFKDYKLNIGLADSFFPPPAPPKPARKPEAIPHE